VFRDCQDLLGRLDLVELKEVVELKDKLVWQARQVLLDFLEQLGQLDCLEVWELLDLKDQVGP